MEYIIHLAILVGIYAILGLSLNLAVGYTGVISVTHAAFFGIGAYTTAILATRHDINFFFAMVVGAVVTGVVSLLIGRVLSKFRGDYVALGAVGFNMIVWSIMLNWQELTRGPLGLPGIHRPEIFDFSFSGNFSFLLLTLFFLLIVFLVCRYITESSFGRALKAIREDEEALTVFGYRTLYYKLVVLDRKSV